jgi:hypothetical protein
VAERQASASDRELRDGPLICRKIGEFGPNFPLRNGSGGGQI